jgi:hypothetical protein
VGEDNASSKLNEDQVRAIMIDPQETPPKARPAALQSSRTGILSRRCRGVVHIQRLGSMEFSRFRPAPLTLANLTSAVRASLKLALR